MGLSRKTATADFSPRVFWLIGIFVALLHGLMAVTAVNTKSPTFDEPQHLTAGYSFWVTNDFRLDPENGNLPARWAALPLLFENLKFVSANDPTWQHADEAGIAHQFFYELGNDPDRMIADARLMMSIFGIALCLLIYRIAREFFGVIGGLLAETVAAFDPNLIAHSALVTSDVAATFFFTATLWSSWRLLQKISPARLTIAALSLSGLFLTKFSALIVLPVLAAMSVLRVFSQAEIAISVGKFRTALTETQKKLRMISGLWLAFGAAVVFAIWLSFSFRYSALTDYGPSRKGWDNCWSAILSDSAPGERAIDFARVHHLLPEAYLFGFAYTRKSAEFRPSFLDNQWSLVGFASFFPRAFLYKTPLPLLCMIALAAGVAIWRREKWRSSILLNPFLIFALAYAAFALGAQLSIGHRHILPIYPAIFIGCGALALLAQKDQRKLFAGAIAVLLCWQIGESVAVRPNYLAYFNQIAGGPSRGYQHLVDSSLDWGQDLPTLKSWIDNHHADVDGKALYLAYFGSADPRASGIEAQRLPENHSTGDLKLVPLIGGVYCISATTLQSVYAREIGPWSQIYEQHYQASLAAMKVYSSSASHPAARVTLIANDGANSWANKVREFERLRFERLCAHLRHRAPDAQIGYSIFVFDLADAEIDRALYGSPAELTPEIRVTGY